MITEEQKEYTEQYFKDEFNEELEPIDQDYILDLKMVYKTSNGMMISSTFVKEFYNSRDDEEMQEKIKDMTKRTYEHFSTSDKTADQIYKESKEFIKRGEHNFQVARGR